MHAICSNVKNVFFCRIREKNWKSCNFVLYSALVRLITFAIVKDVVASYHFGLFRYRNIKVKVYSNTNTIKVTRALREIFFSF
jgi:hypothetical protein